MKESQKKVKKTNSKQKVVFIDWNGTLSPSSFWVHLEKSGNQKDRELFRLWADTMFIKHKEKIVPWMKGEYTTEEILKLIAIDTNTNFDLLLKEFIKGCEQMEYSSPKIPELVNQLRDKSVMVTIATNNMDSFTRWTVPVMHLNYLFDDILNSFYLKALKHELDRKGQPLFFRKFFEKYNIDPFKTECTFIDDGEDKMEVISNLGMNYKRVTSKNTLEQELSRILANL